MKLTFVFVAFSVAPPQDNCQMHFSQQVSPSKPSQANLTAKNRLIMHTMILLFYLQYFCFFWYSFHDLLGFSNCGWITKCLNPPSVWRHLIWTHIWHDLWAPAKFMPNVFFCYFSHLQHADLHSQHILHFSSTFSLQYHHLQQWPHHTTGPALVQLSDSIRMQLWSCPTGTMSPGTIDITSVLGCFHDVVTASQKVPLVMGGLWASSIDVCLAVEEETALSVWDDAGKAVFCAEPKHKRTLLSSSFNRHDMLRTSISVFAPKNQRTA